MADVIGVEMLYLPKAVGAPLGDALLAGVAVGVIGGCEAISGWLGEMMEVKPDEGVNPLYDRYYRIYKRLLEVCGDVFMELG